MYDISIRLHSAEGRTDELLSNDLETAELLVENIVGLALLEVFEGLAVEDVNISHSSGESATQQST